MGARLVKKADDGRSPLFGRVTTTAFSQQSPKLWLYRSCRENLMIEEAWNRSGTHGKKGQRCAPPWVVLLAQEIADGRNGRTCKEVMPTRSPREGVKWQRLFHSAFSRRRGSVSLFFGNAQAFGSRLSNTRLFVRLSVDRPPCPSAYPLIRRSPGYRDSFSVQANSDGPVVLASRDARSRAGSDFAYRFNPPQGEPSRWPQDFLLSAA